MLIYHTFKKIGACSMVFASPTGYMLTSSGFPTLNWGIFYKFLKNDR